MIDETESPLRRALDAIDAARRRATVTLAACWLATFGAVIWFMYVLRTNESLKPALSAAVVALVFAIFLAAASIMLYMSRMTKRVLRAIEVAIITRTAGDEGI